MTQVLTSTDIAKRLRISKGQVSKLMNGKVKGAPRLKVMNIGRRKLVRDEALEEWCREAEACNGDH